MQTRLQKAGNFVNATKKWNQAVHFIFMTAAVLWFLKRTIEIKEAGSLTMIQFGLPLLGFAVAVITVHIFKILRLYLVLMEQKIRFRHFIRLYIKTIFVNFILPFKTGELFRIYCFSYETKIFQLGILSVFVDRFFDTCALLVFLVPYNLIGEGKIHPVTILLLLMTAVLWLSYWVFGKSYAYLNKYFIVYKSSKRTVQFLTVLEYAKSWYDYIRELIKGRHALILLVSCAGWITEFAALFCLSVSIWGICEINSLAEYLYAIFGMGNSELLGIHVFISTAALILALFFIYLPMIFRRSRKNAEKDNLCL